MELSSYPSKNGVVYLEAYQTSKFEESYFKIREKENRILTDLEVIQLPHLLNHPHSKEWRLRQESAERFLSYLFNKELHILEVGCGNGWFSNLLASFGHQLIATDVNVQELEQAARVFKSTNVSWVYTSNLDLLQPVNVDLIVFNASIQYFPSVSNVLNIAKKLLSEKGEIHVIDSPFYKNSIAANKALERTRNYYQFMGYPELCDEYHHHTIKDVLKADWLYTPSFIGKIMGKRNPFPWLRFQKINI